MRQFKDAYSGGLAAIAIVSHSKENAPSTSKLFSNNDSRVTVAYESTDLSKVVFVSLNYLSGEIEYMYSISKGVTE